MRLAIRLSEHKSGQINFDSESFKYFKICGDLGEVSMIKSVPNWIYYSHEFSRIFPNCLSIFLGQNTEPTDQLPCCRTPRSDWLAWAVPWTRRYKAYPASPTSEADYALSKAATPAVRAQRHCPRHRTHTPPPLLRASPSPATAYYRPLVRPSRPRVTPFFIESWVVGSPRRAPLFLWPPLTSLLLPSA
jgi:hypothetical protein